MRPQGLGPGVDFTTNGTVSSVSIVFSLQVSVESLHEGCPFITEVTSPGFVVRVVHVHVVNQPSEPPALFLTNLAKAKNSVVLSDFLLCNFVHGSFLWNMNFCSWSPSFSFLWLFATKNIIDKVDSEKDLKLRESNGL